MLKSVIRSVEYILICQQKIIVTLRSGERALKLRIITFFF